ncbi:MAG: polysaccharide deacetylase family protein [Butyrivibrio sp.]
MKRIYLLLLLLIMLFTGCSQTESTYRTRESVIETENSTNRENNTSEETFTTEENTTTEESTTEESTTQEETYSEDKARDEYYASLVEQARADKRKVVYLTFDDGPGMLTPTVLDILDEYGVKATFFVVGAYSSNEDYARTEYNDIINRGHTLGIHSFTHARADIYASLEAFSKDCDRMMNYVRELTGYTPFLWRFPGGSSTMYADSRMKTEYIPYVESKGLTYYDWNVSSGDGNGATTANQIYNNVINGVKNKDVSVVLMHDGNGHEETIAALRDILNTLINELDCLIVPITESTSPVHSQ